MPPKIDRSSVMLVTCSQRTSQGFTAFLPAERFSPVKVASSAGEARRTMLDTPLDIAIIDTPLKDDFGIQLALDLAQNEMTGIILLVKAEQYEHVYYRTVERGVLTISKPMDKSYMLQCLGFLEATRYKLLLMKRKSETLEKKMEEISLINRAKLLLIEKYKMSEADAHRYIEKSAMDHCVKRVKIAIDIIEENRDIQNVKG